MTTLTEPDELDEILSSYAIVGKGDQNGIYSDVHTLEQALLSWANKRIKLPEKKEFEEGLEPIETAKRLDDFYRGWNAYDTAVKELNNIKEDTDE